MNFLLLILYYFGFKKKALIAYNKKQNEESFGMTKGDWLFFRRPVPIYFVKGLKWMPLGTSKTVSIEALKKANKIVKNGLKNLTPMPRQNLMELLFQIVETKLIQIEWADLILTYLDYVKANGKMILKSYNGHFDYMTEDQLKEISIKNLDWARNNIKDFIELEEAYFKGAVDEQTNSFI